MTYKVLMGTLNPTHSLTPITTTTTIIITIIIKIYSPFCKITNYRCCITSLRTQNKKSITYNLKLVQISKNYILEQQKATQSLNVQK